MNSSEEMRIRCGCGGVFSVDVLAFATRWSMNPVPGLNNVAVEAFKVVQAKSRKHNEFQPHARFHFSALEMVVLVPGGSSDCRGLSV